MVPASSSKEGLPAGVAAPARRALAAAGCRSLRDVAELHGIGPNALKVLRRALAEQGRSFEDAK